MACVHAGRYPFLGNDMYRECGDLFSVHVVANPDPVSQRNLLAAVAPDVPKSLLARLVRACLLIQQ